MKLCNRCGCNHPLISFNKDKTRTDGLSVWCRNCTTDYTRSWRKNATPEKLIKYQNDVKLWHDTHREQKRSNDARWRTDNPERRRTNGIKWRQRNKSHVSAYRRRNRGVINARMGKRRASKKQATPPWAEHDKITTVYQKSIELSALWNITLEVDHIIPLVSPTVCGLHCWNNLQLLCTSDNCAKHNIYQQDW